MEVCLRHYGITWWRNDVITWWPAGLWRQWQTVTERLVADFWPHPVVCIWENWSPTFSETRTCSSCLLVARVCYHWPFLTSLKRKRRKYKEQGGGGTKAKLYPVKARTTILVKCVCVGPKARCEHKPVDHQAGPCIETQKLWSPWYYYPAFLFLSLPHTHHWQNWLRVVKAINQFSRLSVLSSVVLIAREDVCTFACLGHYHKYTECLLPTLSYLQQV